MKSRIARAQVLRVAHLTQEVRSDDALPQVFGHRFTQNDQAGVERKKRGCIGHSAHIPTLPERTLQLFLSVTFVCA
jgi:hypothetical protein